MRLYSTTDPYDFESRLTEAERAVLVRLRTFLDREVAPIVDDYWERGEFPVHLPDLFAAERFLDPAELREAGEDPSALFIGFRVMEIARVDASVSTYFSGQATMIIGAVLHGADDAQIAEWMPRIDTYDLRGVFAITEPDHGSDVARGMRTTARRDGGEWLLDGRKMWIGSAAYATHVCVVAREESGAIRAFLVPTDAPGLTIEKIAGKASLRIVDNARITLEGVRVPESARLQRVERFADVARMLRHMRASTVWQAVGVQMGAYENALRYVTTREQFGREIGRFQLVQEKIARMLGNITASLGMAVRLAELQQQGVYRDEDSALAKYWVCARLRETVALAREVCGGNGILLVTGVARHFADAEAIYTYEGTNEISALMAGRAATGLSAFI
ncbi:acyl-CoA dehydrogenase family protein [Microbacterium sp. CPCC 204701]|uniref:acyl-CoA dehydrogenase family protein n=1 Tax=Microbacterium sp. CPCC 204701 TaxID=2493084 RepID=UPI000FDA3A30|nr:acyl-CoA dehydrogenase family protein [Microbacterium sp. CPCC 204701]